MTCSLLRASLGCAALIALGMVGGCSIPLQGASSPQPSPEAVAACGSRADEEYLRQHRDAIYRADRYDSSIRDSPYAAQGLPETSAGLSAQYERNQDVRHCLNGAVTAGQPEPAETAAP